MAVCQLVTVCRKDHWQTRTNAKTSQLLSDKHCKRSIPPMLRISVRSDRNRWRCICVCPGPVSSWQLGSLSGHVPFASAAASLLALSWVGAAGLPSSLPLRCVEGVLLVQTEEVAWLGLRVFPPSRAYICYCCVCGKMTKTVGMLYLVCTFHFGCHHIVLRTGSAVAKHKRLNLL